MSEWGILNSKVGIHISEGGITHISEVGLQISEMNVHISEVVLILEQ